MPHISIESPMRHRGIGQEDIALAKATRDEAGRIPADLEADNPAVRNHAIFWTLHQARFD